jgi:superfamily II DNA/RNA helicase
VLPALSACWPPAATAKRRAKGMDHGPRVLVLVPTRELALQVTKAAATYGRHVQGLRVAMWSAACPMARS